MSNTKVTKEAQRTRRFRKRNAGGRHAPIAKSTYPRPCPSRSGKGVARKFGNCLERQISRSKIPLFSATRKTLRQIFPNPYFRVSSDFNGLQGEKFGKRFCPFRCVSRELPRRHDVVGAKENRREFAAGQDFCSSYVP